MKKMAEVYITPEGAYVKAPFNLAFINWLKAEVPPSMRKWDAESRMWWVGKYFEGVLLGHIGRFYTTFVHDQEGPTREEYQQDYQTHYRRNHRRSQSSLPRSSLTVPDACDILGISVSDSAVVEVVKKAFRKKAFDNHPDRNSSPEAGEKMKQINAAWALLKNS
jgi:hypothetical protein